MSFFLDWYSDGLAALAGLVLLSLILLAITLNGVRTCAPITRLLPFALCWHFVAYLFNAFWLLPFYGDGSDALGYHNDGTDIARQIREGAWGTIVWGVGTKAMNIIAGVMYAPFGANVYGVLLFSAVLSLAGGLYLCRAFKLWASPAQTTKYSLIVLFMPSIAVWTSDFGKDSWIAFGLGMAVYGYSRIQKSSISKGIWHFVAGCAITAVVRPHIALAIVVSMTTAYLWGLTQRTRGSGLMKVLRILVLFAMVSILYPVARDFIGLSEDYSANNVDEYMRRNSASLAQAGGSVVEVEAAPGVAGAIRAFPRGIVRVLLEPFPWEIRNVNAALAAMENLFIAWFVLLHAIRLPKLIQQMVRRPYILFCGFSALALLMMFSLLPNLGLISRERAELLPFLFAPLVAADGVRRRGAPIAGIWRAVTVENSELPLVSSEAGAPVSLSKV
jgi:hypothetical protein